MRKTFFIALTAAATLWACSRNPITGRNQLSLVPDAQVASMAVGEYQQFLGSNKVVSDADRNTQMVKRVGKNLIYAITNYYNQQGLGQELANYQWEINLVDSKDVNAWCMPGGKIVVYTGILPVTQNETALAIVMGHEIAHALAKHGAERMSQVMVAQMGGQALDVMLAKQPQQTRAIFSQAYGLGAQYGVIMPHGRKHELEADKFGLVFAALAGYDPRESVNFWQRMAQMGGQKPPEFMSTHPSDETRIAKLQEMMPEILSKYYKPVTGPVKK